jgi:hypothetical protein
MNKFLLAILLSSTTKLPNQMIKHMSYLLTFLLCLSGVAQVPGASTNLVVTPINTGRMIQFMVLSSSGDSAINNYEYSTEYRKNTNHSSNSILT